MATQHSLPSGRYPLLGPDSHRLDRTSLRLAHSLDHLVGAGEHRGGEVQAERLGGFQIDDQLVLGGLLNRQVGGLGALKNLVDVGGGTTIEIVGIGAVTHEATRKNVLLKWEHARQAVLERERSEWHALANNQR